MMLDLDKFKEVNDNYGHSVGDTTLKQFAKILVEAASEEKALVGRWGGEEFVIICRDKDGDAAVKMAESLREKVAAFQFPDIYHIRIRSVIKRYPVARHESLPRSVRQQEVLRVVKVPYITIITCPFHIQWRTCGLQNQIDT